MPTLSDVRDDAAFSAEEKFGPFVSPTKKPRAPSGISLGILPAEWHQKIAELCEGTALSPARVTRQIKAEAQRAAAIAAAGELGSLERKYKGKTQAAKP